MIEQMTSTQVGIFGMLGFLLTVAVGVALHAWIVKEMNKSDGASD